MANTFWSNTDKDNVTLSGGDLTATLPSGIQGWVRALDQQGVGKFYWEMQPTVWQAGSGGDPISSTNIGISAGGPVYPFNAAPANLCVIYQTGHIWFDGYDSGYTLGTRGNNDIIGIALDLDNSLIWFRLAPTGLWNGVSTANPAAGTDGIPISSLFGGLTDRTAFPIALFKLPGDSVTANFGDSAFSGTVPSGFTAGFTAGYTPATTILIGGAVRETLLTEAAAERYVKLASLVREALVSGTGLAGRITAKSQARASATVLSSGISLTGTATTRSFTKVPPPSFGVDLTGRTSARSSARIELHTDVTLEARAEARSRASLLSGAVVLGSRGGGRSSMRGAMTVGPPPVLLQYAVSVS